MEKRGRGEEVNAGETRTEPQAAQSEDVLLLLFNLWCRVLLLLLQVINWERTLVFPSEIIISEEAEDLVKRLCTDPSNRLGKGGVEVRVL